MVFIFDNSNMCVSVFFFQSSFRLFRMLRNDSIESKTKKQCRIFDFRFALRQREQKYSKYRPLKIEFCREYEAKDNKEKSKTRQLCCSCHVVKPTKAHKSEIINITYVLHTNEDIHTSNAYSPYRLYLIHDTERYHAEAKLAK